MKKKLVVALLVSIMATSGAYAADISSMTPEELQAAYTELLAENEELKAQIQALQGGESAPEDTAPATGTEITAQGETFILSVTGLHRYDEYKGLFETKYAPDGKEFVVIDLLAENISSEDEYFSNFNFQCYVDGLAIEGDWLFEMEGFTLMDGDIHAGKKRQGSIAFELPKGWQEFEINYEEMFGGEALTLIVPSDFA